MNQEPEMNANDETRTEYDFSGGILGKYYEAYMQSNNVVILDSDYEAYMQSNNVVILDSDVAEIFRDSASVNEALRLLAKIAKSMSL